jgi:hypothetical protein
MLEPPNLFFGGSQREGERTEPGWKFCRKFEMNEPGLGDLPAKRNVTVCGTYRNWVVGS